MSNNVAAELTQPEPEPASASTSVSPSSELGKRLRRQRLAAGFTLEQLASRAGIGKGYLSRIENGKKVPPIATLSRLAGALGLDMAALLVSPRARKPWHGVSVVRHDEKRPAVLGGTTFGYDYFALSDSVPTQVLQPFLFTFPEQIDKFVFFQHDGEELLHILTGRVEWQVGAQKFVLEAGDTMHFDSRIPHRGHSLSGPATALVVMYSPAGMNDSLA